MDGTAWEGIRDWAGTRTGRNVGHVAAFALLLLLVPEMSTVYLGLMLGTRRGIALGAIASVALAAGVVVLGYVQVPVPTLARSGAFLADLRRDMGIINGVNLVAAFVAGCVLRRAFVSGGPAWRSAAQAMLAAAVLYVPHAVHKDRLWDAYAVIQSEDAFSDAQADAAKAVGEAASGPGIDPVTAEYLRQRILAARPGEAPPPFLASREAYVAHKERAERERAARATTGDAPPGAP